MDLWPGLVGHYSVRIRGLKAPELRGAGCEAEKEWALEAKAKAERLYDVGKVVLLKNVQYDAFSGRVLADVERWRSDRWLSFKDEMIAAEMGVEWTPDMEDVPWCLLAETRAN